MLMQLLVCLWLWLWLCCSCSAAIGNRNRSMFRSRFGGTNRPSDSVFKLSCPRSFRRGRYRVTWLIFQIQFRLKCTFLRHYHSRPADVHTLSRLVFYSNNHPGFVVCNVHVVIASVVSGNGSGSGGIHGGMGHRRWWCRSRQGTRAAVGERAGARGLIARTRNGVILIACSS